MLLIGLLLHSVFDMFALLGYGDSLLSSCLFRVVYTYYIWLSTSSKSGKIFAIILLVCLFHLILSLIFLLHHGTPGLVSGIYLRLLGNIVLDPYFPFIYVSLWYSLYPVHHPWASLSCIVLLCGFFLYDWSSSSFDFCVVLFQ